MLFKGHTHRELYQFSPVSTNSRCRNTNVNLNAELGATPSGGGAYDWWHRRLGHPLRPILHSMLKLCNVVLNNKSSETVCSAC